MAGKSPLPAGDAQSGRAFFKPLPTARSIRLMDLRFESDKLDNVAITYHTASNLILKLCELYQTDKLDLEGAVYQLSVPMAKKHPFQDERLRELGLPLTDGEDWLALAKYFSKPYFERVWVLQELVVSSAPVGVFCGSFQLPWAAFEITHICQLPLGWDIAIKNVIFAHGKE